MKRFTIWISLLLSIPAIVFSQDKGLSTKIPNINFGNIPLSDCFTFIQDISNQNIIVDWKNITASGIMKDENIDLHLKNVTVQQTLNLLLEQVSDTLVYYNDNGAIRITTKDVAYTHTVTKVYDVQDLLAVTPNFTIQNNVEPQTQPQNSQPTTPSQTYSLPSSVQPSQLPIPNTPTVITKPDAQLKSLITLIESSIEPTIWFDNGGTVGYISSFNGLLIVTAPESVQEQIVGK
jgi:hypothetical protein